MSAVNIKEQADNRAVSPEENQLTSIFLRAEEDCKNKKVRFKELSFAISSFEQAFGLEFLPLLMQVFGTHLDKDGEAPSIKSIRELQKLRDYFESERGMNEQTDELSSYIFQQIQKALVYKVSDYYLGMLEQEIELPSNLQYTETEIEAALIHADLLPRPSVDSTSLIQAENSSPDKIEELSLALEEIAEKYIKAGWRSIRFIYFSARLKIILEEPSLV